MKNQSINSGSYGTSGSRLPIEYGLRPTPTCQPALPLYVVVLTWTCLTPCGVDTSRSYTVGSIGMAAANPQSENQHAASDVAAWRRFLSIGSGTSWLRVSWGPMA